MSTVAASPHSALRQTGADRIGIGYALVDNCSASDACSAIISHAQRRGAPCYVITPNAQHIVLLDRDRRLREIYQRAGLIVPDGVSLLLAARIYGRSLHERVAGVDLFQALCERAAGLGLRVFLLGGRPGSAESAADTLKQRFPGLHAVSYCPPFGFEQSADTLAETAAAIERAAPDLLFVALGAPKQEYWIYEHGLSLSVPVCVGVGGSFEMVAGIVQRAPELVQKIGCEWLYRLCVEPRRMWRRYLIGNLQFIAIVVRQRIRRAFLDMFLSLLKNKRFGAELQELRLRHADWLSADGIADFEEDRRRIEND